MFVLVHVCQSIHTLIQRDETAQSMPKRVAWHLGVINKRRWGGRGMKLDPHAYMGKYALECVTQIDARI